MMTLTGASMRSASLSRLASRIAAVATTGDEYCWMSTSASAGTSSNCRLARSIASRHAPTRSSGSAQWVGRSTTSPDTRFVHGSSSSPVRIDTGTIARSGLVRQRVVLDQVVAQGTGADRHHDVVERAARRVLDPLEVAELAVAHGEPAVGRDALVPRRRRCRRHRQRHPGAVGRRRDASALIADPACCGGRADARDAGRVGDVADHPQLGAHRLDGVADQVGDRQAQQLEVARDLVGLPRPGSRRVAGRRG